MKLVSGVCNTSLTTRSQLSIASSTSLASSMLYSSTRDRKLGRAGLIMWVGDCMGPVCQEDTNVAHPLTVKGAERDSALFLQW